MPMKSRPRPPRECDTAASCQECRHMRSPPAKRVRALLTALRVADASAVPSALEGAALLLGRKSPRLQRAGTPRHGADQEEPGGHPSDTEAAVIAVWMGAIEASVRQQTAPTQHARRQKPCDCTPR